MPNSKLFTVDKFLGIDESADSARELKMGQASRVFNFAITDGSNIATRPGLTRIFSAPKREPCAVWSGHLGSSSYLIVATHNGQRTAYSFAVMRQAADGAFEVLETIHTVTDGLEESACKIFAFSGNVYIFVGGVMLRVEIEETADGPVVTTATESGYVPLILTGCAPAGGGTLLESLNILSDAARVQYSADGEATAYVLPEIAGAVLGVSIDGEAADPAQAGAFDADTHTFTFAAAPAKGVNNVEFTVQHPDEDLAAARKRFFRMPWVEAYNGSSDSRLFFYGDGSNITYYTGVTESGRPSALYVPAGNEIVVDMSDSAITGMTRHYSKLLVYKPDCTASISYEPMTLADGAVIAGFTLHTIHKTAGNQAPGQVRICGNYPRSIGNGHVYEWRVPSSYYTDERYAKVMSDAVRASLAAADASGIVVCCDSAASTYYIFLNDEEGTVLVNRYAMEAWTIYRSKLLTDVTAAVMHGTTMVILARTEVGGVPCANCFILNPEARYDACLNGDTENLDPVNAPQTDAPIPISAEWHTGYMDFGADYLRKFSSNIWVSLLPQTSSKVTVTAATDRQDAYSEKDVGSNLFSYAAVDYAHWSYNVSRAPKIRALKLKVKKFVYYKLIFRVDEPGARITILGYDQRVRYGSYVK